MQDLQENTAIETAEEAVEIIAEAAETIPVPEVSALAKSRAGPSRGLRIGLSAICAFSVILTAAFGISIYRSSYLAASFSDAHAQLLGELSNAQSQLADTLNALEAAESQNADLKGYTEELESRADQLESQTKALEEQNSSLTAQIEAMREELNRLQLMKASVDSASLSGGEKLIALTFDDGPGELTASLLDELKARGMVATFFVIGSRAERYPDVLRRMTAEGHEIGTHSYTHRNLTKMGTDEMTADIAQSIQTIQNITGTTPGLLRPPGGNVNDALKTYAAEQGLCIINWSVDTYDWKSRNVESIMNSAFRNNKYGIQDGAIVLMHDIYATSIDGARAMMDRLQSEGYVTVTVSELLYLRAGGGTPGEVYHTCLSAS